jgi:uncharacterized protein (TIGR02302 family)
VTEPRLRLAYAILLWERLWRHAWPASGVGGLFGALALLDAPSLLSPWQHVAFLGIFALALIVGLIFGFRGFRLPSRREVLRRIETESGLAHRPLADAKDKMAAGNGDPLAEEIWLESLKRRLASLARLRTGWPRPGLARRDPQGLRALVLILLVIGGVVGGGEAKIRLMRALTPSSSLLAGSSEMQVWITPPAYTGVAPMLLGPAKPPANLPLRVPTGSGLQILAQGGKTPSFSLGNDKKEFENLGHESWRLEARITSGERLSVRQGWGKPIDWPILVIPDRPPTIAFTGPPQDEKGRLGVAYLAEDDYAVASVTLLIRRVDPDGMGAELELPLGLPSPRPTSARHLVWSDLAAHPWAGIPVGLQLVAKDEAGHVTAGELITFTLPERQFRHPVARALIEVRKHIVQHPYRRASAIASLEELMADPSLFDHDVTAYLAMSVAASRLNHDFAETAIASILDLLWKAALRIEEGKVADSARGLEEARQELREALQKGASNNEIARLIENLRQAMIEHLRALATSLAPNEEVESEVEALDADELAGLMEKIDELDRLGRREAAEKLLAELDEMMQALQNARPMDAETKKSLKEMRGLRKALEDIVRRQERLIEDTQKAIEAKPTDDQAPLPGELASRQDVLRDELGQKLDQMLSLLGEIPEDFLQALAEMDKAATALSRFLPKQALPPEREALALLKKGNEAAKQAAEQRLGRAMSLGLGARPRGGVMGRDPLGRPTGIEERKIGIPSENELRKAREMLDELRRRAGEFRRPRSERDYIERLLKVF